MTKKNYKKNSASIYSIYRVQIYSRGVHWPVSRPIDHTICHCQQ